MIVIRITGKAHDVFACIEWMAEKAGKLTIGDIIKERRIK